MRTAWLIWLATTLVLSGYFVSGYIASRTVIVPIVLSAVSIGHDSLRMELEFSGEHMNRAELGEYRHKDQWRATGRLEFPNPGEEILGIIEFVGHNDPIFSAAKDWLQSVQYLPRSSCGVERGSWDMEMAADKLWPRSPARYQ